MADYRITGNAYQGYTLRAAWGAVEMKPFGIEVDLPRVRSIGLENLCDVQSHTINRIANSTSHVVHFIGGGHVQFAYNDKGQLLELSGQSVNVRMSQDGAQLHFSPYRLPDTTR